ncbi:DUF4262 domain-containing protein [Roseovarius aestuarii]|uniref:DUF4262 domain-containing protein n=1 Tax=Roseovarius aestuarii TaxID=475083 RepID=A0A1X7BLT7_9RHOB|nr:DUF4262 domain-containing protein [Roseovarius aestuarii]SMC10587.1 hypothetical protein ROA7745_00394 [Roseovarius aestuarii]
MKPEQTALSDPADDQNDYERELVAQVREFGWRSTHVQTKEEASPSFTYSTGFWLTLQAPEIIIFDFPGTLAHDVLGQIFREIQGGRDLRTGLPTKGILANEEVVLLPVRQSAAPEYLVSSIWFYKGAQVPCLQLVWPDSNGLFPWQTGFDNRLSGRQLDLSDEGWSQ